MESAGQWRLIVPSAKRLLQRYVPPKDLRPQAKAAEVTASKRSAHCVFLLCVLFHSPPWSSRPVVAGYSPPLEAQQGRRAAFCTANSKTLLCSQVLCPLHSTFLQSQTSHLHSYLYASYTYHPPAVQQTVDMRIALLLIRKLNSARIAATTTHETQLRSHA